MGYINADGKEIVVPRYDLTTDFFGVDLGKVMVEDKWGFVDKTGKEVVPLVYDEAQFFRGDFTQAKKNGKWGFIDKTGQEIGGFIYDAIYPWGFKEGLAAVTEDGKWGFIGKDGREVVMPKYDEVCYGAATAWRSKGMANGVTLTHAGKR